MDDGTIPIIASFFTKAWLHCLALQLAIGIACRMPLEASKRPGFGFLFEAGQGLPAVPAVANTACPGDNWIIYSNPSEN